MRRLIRLQPPVPRPRNGNYIRGVPPVQRSDSGTNLGFGLNDGVSIPSQQSPQKIRVYNPGGTNQPDIRAVFRSLEASRGLPNVNPDLNETPRNIQYPGGSRLVNFSATTLGTSPTLGTHIRYKLRQVLPVRPDRNRFLLCNPDAEAGGSGATLYFSFTNLPNALLPLYPGQIWDETGTTISKDDLWIGGPNAGDLFIVMESRLPGDYER